MKTQIILFFTLICFTIGTLSAQKKNQDKKSNQETIVSGSIESLLSSKSFEFIANTAYPISGSPKNLVGSGYSITFSPEMIVSNMPFYGRAYSGMALGRDKGMRFKGKPESFTIEKNKEYQVNTIVADGDSYTISLSVSDSGYATLAISSNNRGTITYQGELRYSSK